VRLEREHCGHKAKPARRLNNLPEERLVAEMHSVEVSDGQSAVELLPGAGQSAKDVSGGEKIHHSDGSFHARLVIIGWVKGQERVERLMRSDARNRCSARTIAHGRLNGYKDDQL
jgi:hypothetical protein